MKGVQRKKPARAVGFRSTVLGAPELARIGRLVEERGSRQTRQDLARACCRMFDWRGANGRWAVRSAARLLVRLEAGGMFELPAPRRAQGQARAVALPETVAPLAHWAPTVAALEAGLVVRPIVAAERAQWRALMQRHHYLGDAPLVGESLRYVALLEGEAVALLSWAAASLRNRARERYLGWDEAARRANLHRVVNNARFLVLPGAQGRHNLASRVLGANLRRLARDWEHAYAHRVVLAETFIDRTRFRGTCYRASNWLCVGQSAGWAKCGVRYRFHGQPKSVWLYALARDFRTQLCTNTVKENAMMELDFARLPLDGQGGLFEILRALPDPRQARGVRHRIESLVGVALCATLAGARTITAMAEWASEQSGETLRRFGSKRGKPPSERTLRRLLASVDVEEVDRRTGAWMAEQHLRLAALALDGKTMRGSREGQTPARHLLSAVVHGTGAVLAQRAVDAKTNEITQVEPLLEALELEGVVVTTDALLTQRRLASYLVEEKKAHYVFTVKDNQPTLRADIEALHLEASPPLSTPPWTRATGAWSNARSGPAPRSMTTRAFPTSGRCSASDAPPPTCKATCSRGARAPRSSSTG